MVVAVGWTYGEMGRLTASGGNGMEHERNRLPFLQSDDYLAIAKLLPFARLWCIVEMHAALVSNKPLIFTCKSGIEVVQTGIRVHVRASQQAMPGFGQYPEAKGKTKRTNLLSERPNRTSTKASDKQSEGHNHLFTWKAKAAVSSLFLLSLLPLTPFTRSQKLPFAWFDR